MKDIERLFIRVRDAHKFYTTGDNAYKKRIYDALAPTFSELSGMGVPQDVYEFILYFGQEYAESLNNGDAGPIPMCMPYVRALYGLSVPPAKQLPL
jgi:hypothetical protein